MYLAINGWDKDCGISISKRDNALEKLYRCGMIFGFGCDSERMIRIIMHTTKHELSQVCVCYQRKFGKDLMREVHACAGYTDLGLYRQCVLSADAHFSTGARFNDLVRPPLFSCVHSKDFHACIYAQDTHVQVQTR